MHTSNEPPYTRSTPRCEFASRHPVDPRTHRCKEDATVRFTFKNGEPAVFCARHAANLPRHGVKREDIGR